MGSPTITLSLTSDHVPEPLASMTLPIPMHDDHGCPSPDETAMLDRLWRSCAAFVSEWRRP